MSFAIHLFMSEKFSKESFQQFLAETGNLYGKWNLVEHVPFNEDARHWKIEEHVIQSENVPVAERFSVWAAAKRMSPAVTWGFDFAWQLSLETSAGRSPIGLAVQLGSLLVAMERFKWFVVIDHDTCVKNEPIEFRSKEAVIGHIKRVMTEDFSLDLDDLKRRKILNEEGHLLLPQ